MSASSVTRPHHRVATAAPVAHSSNTRFTKSRTASARPPKSSIPIPRSRSGAYPLRRAFAHHHRHHRSTVVMLASSAAAAAAGAAAEEEEDLPGSLLPWLAKVTDDASLESKVALQDLGDGRGRGLRALRNLAPGEVIFSLPFSLVFAEQHDDDDDDAALPWSALMAMRLLEERARGGELAPWIDSLPSFVSTPPLEFTGEELAMAEDVAAEAEAAAVADAHARAAESLRERLEAVGCAEEDLRWATGVLHSRCFTHGPRGTHLAVPGVDMCNHCFEAPTAAVKVVTSPDNCQGARATEDIAPAAAGQKGEGDGVVTAGSGGGSGGFSDDDAFFQLCAGEDGVEQGEEVTISYGPWPNDPFFLYFGFVPRGNPNDAVVLFDDVAEVAACAERLGLLSPHQADEAAAAAAAAAEAGGGEGEGKEGGEEEEVQGGVQGRRRRRQRMVITREGVDYSVVEAAAAAGLEGWEAVVEGRCRELLREYSTTLKVDRAMLSGGGEGGEGGGGGGGGVRTENEATAVLYRMSKKEVLLGPLAAAAAAARAAAAEEAAAAAEAAAET